jgi:hypothetical protein
MERLRRRCHHCGYDGAGKTTVLAEASDILTLRHITHAAIDLDALGLAQFPSAASNDGVMCRNLQSVCAQIASFDMIAASNWWDAPATNT